jgi:hypothetical protein
MMSVVYCLQNCTLQLYTEQFQMSNGTDRRDAVLRYRRVCFSEWQSLPECQTSTNCRIQKDETCSDCCTCLQCYRYIDKQHNKYPSMFQGNDRQTDPHNNSDYLRLLQNRKHYNYNTLQQSTEKSNSTVSSSSLSNCILHHNLNPRCSR